MKTVLAIHQGVEKYGSDKSFVAAVEALTRSGAYDVEILLPGRGPINNLLEDAQVSNVHARHLWILRKADIIRAVTTGLPKNLVALRKAIKDIRSHDITYVNTAVVLDFILASIVSRRRIIVHVREIPVGIAMKVIRRLLIAARAKVIFNSQATATAFALPETQDQAVVYNGFAPPASFEKQPYDGTRPLRVLCIGRLNAWKGQEVLVHACALLPEDLRKRLSVRIVGGVYKDQVHFRTNLESLITENDLCETITMQEFVDDPAQEYIDADVVVVPSRLPEPFGRVAIEGMAYGAAVIASDHGGLREIVVDGQTGALVVPDDPQSLANALKHAILSPEDITDQGRAGQALFEQKFTQEQCDRQLLNAMNVQ